MLDYVLLSPHERHRLGLDGPRPADLKPEQLGDVTAFEEAGLERFDPDEREAQQVRGLPLP